MKMAVRHFHVLKVFWGQVEVKICKMFGEKKPISAERRPS